MNKFNEHFNKIKVSDELKEKTMARLKEDGLPVESQAKVEQDFPLVKQFTPQYQYQYPPIAPRQYTPNTSKLKRKRFSRPAVVALVAASVLFVFIALPAIVGVILSGGSLSRPNRDNAPIINASNSLPDIPDYITTMFQVESDTQLRELIRYTPNDWISKPFGGSSNRGFLGCGFLFGCAAVGNWSESAAPGASPPDDNSEQTSVVNIQIEGMDEGDIVRNDGQFIYHLSPFGLNIVQADRGYITPITTISYTNFTPIEMFVRDNRLVVIGGGFTNELPQWIIQNNDIWALRQYHNSTIIRVYDITDRTTPILEQYFEIDGNFNTSRVRMEDETLFFVVNYFPHRFNPDTNQRAVRRPYFRTGPTANFTPLSVDNMYYFKNNPIGSFMILGRIDLGNPYIPPLVNAFLSSADIISVGLNNLYTSSTRWFISRTHRSGNNTFYQLSYIARFCLETLAHTGSVVVNGRPPSRHAIDEHNGYLRVATTYGDWNWSWRNNPDTASAVFVFNSDLELVSSVTNIAVEEQMDSAAFSGDLGFISTSFQGVSYNKIYTIDLTNFNNPIISERLETEGINDYLRPIHGTPFVIGIGQDRQGSGTQQTGIKIELYDMRHSSGLMPESLAKYTIYGSRTFAEALTNPRALLFMICDITKQGFVGFSAESRCRVRVGTSWHNVTFSQGFFLFRVDAIQGTMEFIGDTRGTVRCWQRNIDVPLLVPTFSNFDTSINIPEQTQWDAVRAIHAKYIHRAIINQGYLYTISDKIIAGYSMTTRERISEFNNE